jgi:hypothetical protein
LDDNKMITLSVGMPRAGSGWYYNLTNAIMLTNGDQDAREIRKRYHLQSILTEVNCNIGALTPRRLLVVLIPSLFGNSFVIKAHAAPTPLAVFFMRRGWIKPTYIYRDPRDALLSAMENGERARKSGRTNAFSKLDTFKKAVSFMEEYICIGEQWIQSSETLNVRYENLLVDYDNEIKRLLKFLQVGNINSAIRSVISEYRPENSTPDKKGIHFHHGKIGRFRKKMTFEEQDAMNSSFEKFLKTMRYDI